MNPTKNGDGDIEPLTEEPLDLRVLREFEFSPQLSAATLAKRLGTDEEGVDKLLFEFVIDGILIRTDCHVGGGRRSRWVALYSADQVKLAELLNARTKEWHKSIKNT